MVNLLFQTKLQKCGQRPVPQRAHCVLGRDRNAFFVVAEVYLVEDHFVREADLFLRLVHLAQPLLPSLIPFLFFDFDERTKKANGKK